MMAGTAPIVIPSDYSILRSTSAPKPGKVFSRKNWVIFISLVEMLGSLAGMIIYIYALAVEPSWYKFLVPIPDDLCNAEHIVHGVMYTIILLCLMELLLALYLFEGVRKEKLGRIRFWLSSMLTYLGLITLVILGLDLGGIHCPTMNSAAFINIFLRFLEILVVYAWAEQESMARKMRFHRLGYGGGYSRGGGLSTLTICTDIPEEINNQNGEQTPPPSYSSTIPNARVNNYLVPPGQQEPREIV